MDNSIWRRSTFWSHLPMPTLHFALRGSTFDSSSGGGEDEEAGGRDEAPTIFVVFFSCFAKNKDWHLSYLCVILLLPTYCKEAAFQMTYGSYDFRGFP